MSKLKDKLRRLTMPGSTRVEPPEPSASTVIESLTVTESVIVTESAEALSIDESVTVTESVTVLEEEGSAGVFGDKQTRLSRLRAQMELLRGKVKPEPEPKSFRPVWSEQHGGALPGEVHETPLGALRRVVTVHDEDHRHGSIEVSLALEASSSDLAVLALDPSLEGIDFARALYIDTETTGLAGGAGTLPFLIGMAWFEGQRLVVEQLVLEKPGFEAPMLVRLGEQLAQASCIVSYNGKSFDWPLLRTRFIMNRVAAPKVPAHLDLLHCARRVYKRRLGAVRLVHLEQQILGFERVDDISGELIPQTYLGFLRGHVPGAALAPIIEHNKSDLVALAAIMGELVRRFRGEHAAQDARDQLGFASVAARAEDHQRALAFAHGAAEADVRGELAPDALYLAGELKLRANDVQGALEAFQRSLEAALGSMAQAARAHLALSKLYEHKLKNFERALSHAEQTSAVEGDDACQKRVERLRRKCRAVTPSLFEE